MTYLFVKLSGVGWPSPRPHLRGILLQGSCFCWCNSFGNRGGTGRGGGGESVHFLWKNPMANYMGDLLWDLHRPKAGNRQHTQIMHINNQQFRHDLSQQITTNVISAAWQFLSALCVCKVHKGSVTDSTQKCADRFCKINAPLAKLNHSCNWPLN